jgi:hypothetical protein
MTYDLDFTTAGPGPVHITAGTPEGEAWIGGAHLWCDGPGEAKRTCIDAILDGLSCAVDGREVHLQAAA